MPEMAAVCQDTASTSPNMLGHRGPQGVGTPHAYYNHCGYPAPPSHGQYTTDGYVAFQTSPPEQPSHLQHHVHGHPQQHHQQAWGYGVGMMGSGRPGVLPDEWTQSYLPGSHTPAQNACNYQYRGQGSHVALDYAGPLQTGHDHNPQGMEGSPSSHSSSPGEPSRAGMGPNNQGAKSLRPPYEWMKPSASLPQAGKTRTKDKYRVVYSDHQRLELEKEFHFSKYITIRRKAEIASQLGLSERQVKIWFQNRRAKERKQNKKRDEQVTMLQHGSSSNLLTNGQDLHQRLQHPSSHDQHQHTFIPKLEMEEDKSSIHELACHSSTHAQGAGISSHSVPPTAIVMHQDLHHSHAMSLSPIIMSRSHSHSAIGRYHDNMQASTISPNPTPDEVTYRMTSNADTPGSNMNLSGSSDSGVVSSH